MITHSKRIKSSENDQQSEEKSNYDEIPQDLEIEILKRLPVKSLCRFLLVSKLWATIIHSQGFITPRLLVAFIDLDIQKKHQNWYVFSLSLSSSLTSTSFLSRGACPFLNLNNQEYLSHYVNGLICFGYGREQIICNHRTGKSISLPRVKTRRKTVKSFFGYDPVNDQYKVLCMTRTMDCKWYEASSQHQVFTLGAKQKSWRMIDCSIPHRPSSSKGVCIDGVLYYLAYRLERQLFIIRFDLKSEKFDLFTNLSSGIYRTLINYKGKIALATNDSSPYKYDVRIMEKDAEYHLWLKKSFSIEPWKSLIGSGDLNIRCATHTGDFVLVPPYYYSGEFYVIHFNPDKNSFRKIKTDDVYREYDFKPGSTRAIVFSDCVESVCRRDTFMI